MAIFFITGKAPLRVCRRYGADLLFPRGKGKGEEDPRTVGAHDPFWWWSVRAGTNIFEHRSKLCKLLLYQFATGVPTGNGLLGKYTTFDAQEAQ